MVNKATHSQNALLLNWAWFYFAQTIVLDFVQGDLSCSSFHNPPFSTGNLLELCVFYCFVPGLSKSNTKDMAWSGVTPNQKWIIIIRPCFHDNSRAHRANNSYVLVLEKAMERPSDEAKVGRVQENWGYACQFSGTLAIYWLVVWNIWIIVPFSWEFHNPNWLSYFSEG